MPLPSVKITVRDGGTGRTTQTADGIAAMVVTGVAASGLALLTSKKINSIAEAEAVGITLATHPHAHGQIEGFYGKAGDGAELWIMLVAEATTHAAVFTASTGPMAKLLEDAKGAVTIAGTSMGRAVGYTPAAGVMDYDVPAVAALAQIIAKGWADEFAPVRIIMDGTYLVEPLAGVTSWKGAGDRVVVFAGVTETGKRAASMGAYLGNLAVTPVHQSVARVKSGLFSVNGALTSGLDIKTYTKAQLDSLHEAGITIFRPFRGKLGAFISDDVTLAATTSDYTSLALGRTMDKAIRITYQTYVEEINDNIDVTEEGLLEPASVSYLEGQIRRALKVNMIDEQNASGIRVFIDPTQDVIATNKTNIKVGLRPRGYNKEINVELGYYNPQTA